MLRDEEKISVLSESERMKLAKKAVEAVIGKSRRRKKKSVRRTRRHRK
jgi:hypothetical protein